MHFDSLQYMSVNYISAGHLAPLDWQVAQRSDKISVSRLDRQKKSNSLITNCTAAKILSLFCIILTKQQTLSVTRPFDSSLALYYKSSIVTMRLSFTVTEIWRLKDNGVTSVTFCWCDFFVTSSVTKERWKKGCLLYTSPSPRDRTRSRMPSSA